MENLAKIGRWFYAISLVGLAGQQFYYGSFRPVFVPAFPSPIPGQIVLVYLFSFFLIGAALAIVLEKEIRTTMLLLGSFLLALFLFCHLPFELLVDPGVKQIGSWNNGIKDLSIFSGSAFIIAGCFPDGRAPGQKDRTFLRPLEALIPFGSFFYSIMLVIFGFEHFLYADGVQNLVPEWIPGHLFWTYFAGGALIGAGLAIIFRFNVKLIGILTGTMIFIWFLILHIPRAVVAPVTDKGNELSSVFESLGCSGIAFVIAYAAVSVRPMRGQAALICFFLSAVVSSLSCNAPKPDRYGFLTMLGRDTISIEAISRQGNTLTSDEVDRFPRVRIRHTVVDLNDDGSIRHLVMNIHTPSEPSGQRDRKVVADVAGNKVHLSKTDSTGTVTRDFPTNGSLVVAHVPQMYSLYELYFAAALKQAAALKLAAGKPVQMRQFYIDREFDRFPLGEATVIPLDKGKSEITHDWLSGTGEAMMDSAGNMLIYSGARTTYDVQVKRLDTPPDVKGIADRFEAKETQGGNVKSLSVRDTTRAQIGHSIFTVDYGRPLLRGRTLLGDVIPYDRVWRTGANAATQFTTSTPIKLAGMQVPAGSYTLFTAPDTSGVDLIVNKKTGEWGTEYNRSLNLGMTRIISEVATAPVEEFTISIIPGDNRHGTLVLEWGSFKWIAPIEVQLD
jgi:hypothetical protein